MRGDWFDLFQGDKFVSWPRGVPSGCNLHEVDNTSTEVVFGFEFR